MYSCAICGLNSISGEARKLETIETRQKFYYTVCLKRELHQKKRRKSNTVLTKRFEYIFLHAPDSNKIKELTKELPKKLQWTLVSERHTKGTEIVKEQSVCSNCSRYVNSK